MAVTLQLELNIDCLDLSCLTFKDITKDYSASNTGGYGGSNVPAISDINYVTFLITHGSDDYTFQDSGYLPNGSGTSEQCLKGSDFYGGSSLGYLEFVGGESYTLTYIVNYGDDLTIEESTTFRFPCCGSAVESNLATDYSITELTGCTSIKFTDTTGNYDADDNTGGYGSPNPAYGDIESTLIRFTFNDGRVVDITDFIPTEAVPYITINSQSLGFGDGQIPSQVVTIEYSVYIAGGCRVGYKADKVFFRCQLQNCILAQAAAVLGSCIEGEVDRVIKMRVQYEYLVIASLSNIDCIIGEPEKLYKRCSQNCPPCN